MRPKTKISKGVQMLQKQGHRVEQYILHGKIWWQIDSRILATPDEIKKLADGVYSLRELENIYSAKDKPWGRRGLV